MNRNIAKNTLSFSCSKIMAYLRTPHDIWKALTDECDFTIDACASHENHLVRKYFTKDNDGLKGNWTGEVVYCHPLFDTHIGRWVKKAYHSRCTTVMLLPAATHTRYFHNYIYNNRKAEVRFLEKPTKGFRFGKDDGSPDDPKRIAYIKPLMIVIVRNQTELSPCVRGPAGPFSSTHSRTPCHAGHPFARIVWAAFNERDT